MMKKRIRWLTGGFVFLLFLFICYGALSTINVQLYSFVDQPTSAVIGIISWFILLLIILPIDWILCRKVMQKVDVYWEHHHKDTYYRTK